MNKVKIKAIKRYLFCTGILVIGIVCFTQRRLHGHRAHHGHHGHHGHRHHCHRHGHHQGRYGRGCYGGYYGWGPYYYAPYPYWYYGYPYYPYPAAPTLGVTFVSDGRRRSKNIDFYTVTNRTGRVVTVGTSRESRTVQPDRQITIAYSKKIMTLQTKNPDESITIRPLSRSIVITENEMGRLVIED